MEPTIPREPCNINCMKSLETSSHWHELQEPKAASTQRQVQGLWEPSAHPDSVPTHQQGSSSRQNLGTSPAKSHRPSRQQPGKSNKGPHRVAKGLRGTSSHTLMLLSCKLCMCTSTEARPQRQPPATQLQAPRQRQHAGNQGGLGFQIPARGCGLCTQCSSKQAGENPEEKEEHAARSATSGCSLCGTPRPQGRWPIWERQHLQSHSTESCQSAERRGSALGQQNFMASVLCAWVRCTDYFSRHWDRNPGRGQPTPTPEHKW